MRNINDNNIRSESVALLCALYGGKEKMKRIIALLLVLMMCFALCACGAKTDAEKCLEYAVSKLEGYLWRPDSLSMSSIKCAVDDTTYIFKIDYSAASFTGGSVSDTIYIPVAINEASDNGFATISYGSSKWDDETSQNYSAQIYSSAAAAGEMTFDTKSLREKN